MVSAGSTASLQKAINYCFAGWKSQNEAGRAGVHKTTSKPRARSSAASCSQHGSFLATMAPRLIIITMRTPMPHHHWGKTGTTQRTPRALRGADAVQRRTKGRLRSPS